MDGQGVNNPANKTFTDSAEELITRNSPDLHTLSTDLFTSRQHHVAKMKRKGSKTMLTEEYTLLHSAMCRGWLSALHLEQCPTMGDTKCPWNARLEALIRAYAARGHYFGLQQLQLLLRRGAHFSQRQEPRQGANATQPLCTIPPANKTPPTASQSPPAR